MENDTPSRRRMLLDGRDQLLSALDLLDRADAPPQIGAYIDLALHQLGSFIMSTAEDSQISQIEEDVTQL